MFEGMGGLTHVTGDRDGEPMHPSVPLGDYLGGVFGAAAILAALCGRAADPATPGQEIDLSMTECVIRLMDFMPGALQQSGIVPGRSGNASAYTAPSGTFRTADGRWVTLSGSTHALFVNNCRAIDREELASDPRFSTGQVRLEHRDRINEIFADWCGTHSQREVLDAFERCGGTLAPIFSIDQIVADPQVTARKSVIAVPDPDLGSLDMPGVVPRFVQSPGGVRSTGGRLGQDNELVLAGTLGMSAREIERLREEGVI